MLPHTRLVIAGDGPLRDSLERLSRELGVSGRVRFLGAIPHSEVLHWVSRSSIVLIPSVPVEGVVEATSIAALEAMMARRPVIASDIGGLSEMISSNVTGVLVPPGDADAIAEAMKRLVMDKRLRVRLGDAAGEIVSRFYGTDAWIDKLLHVYEGVLS